MENMEMNEVVATEAMNEVMEAMPSNKTGVKNVVKVGFIGAACVAAWELAVKPLARKLKDCLSKGKAAKKKKNAEGEETDLFDHPLDEIPGMDE